MIITKKKIVMIVLLAIGLIIGLLIVIFPTWFGFGAADPSTNPVPTAIFLYVMPTLLLFWNGIYAGHKFVNKQGFTMDDISTGFILVFFIIAWLIGCLLAIPISLYEIFLKNDY